MFREQWGRWRWKKQGRRWGELGRENRIASLSSLSFHSLLVKWNNGGTFFPLIWDHKLWFVEQGEDRGCGKEEERWASWPLASHSFAILFFLQIKTTLQCQNLLYLVCYGFGCLYCVFGILMEVKHKRIYIYMYISLYIYAIWYQYFHIFFLL